jgi:hypothetical protein
MSAYQLIELDQSEASIVRRHLREWKTGDDERVRPLIAALQQKGALSGVPLIKPRWETNVYPLYYWVHREVGNKRTYRRVVELLSERFPTATNTPLTDKELLTQVTRLVNSEIDILVEDHDYFLFIEAKIPTSSGKVKLQVIEGVHQLVRQYVQGRILEKLTGKRFALAAVGANNAEPLKRNLGVTERALLRLINEDKESLEIIDLSWPLAVAQSAG